MKVTVEYNPSIETQRELGAELSKLYELVPFWRKKKALAIVDRYVEIERRATTSFISNKHIS